MVDKELHVSREMLAPLQSSARHAATCQMFATFLDELEKEWKVFSSIWEREDASLEEVGS